MNDPKHARSHSPRLSRRLFLGTGLAAFGTAWATSFFVRRARPRNFTGSIVGANSALGHALRDGKFPPPVDTTDVGVVIAGGGISGLAAARRLARGGFPDFVLLELEAEPGGNAHSGRNSVSAYPWGAHYVPISGPDTVELTGLFEELGIITGRNQDGLPVYREEFLCADPMERLFMHGRWQEGLVPQTGLSENDRAVIESFFAQMRRFRAARGRDGRRAFTIPLDQSSRDGEFLRLDAITMADYLRDQNWLGCEPLRWYVNYCCRDDYGAGLDKISAWAGVHYFASRDGRAANAPDYAVVTWPEGNGWFVRQLRFGLDDRLRSSCAVWNVESAGDGLLVDYYDDTRKQSRRLRARGVVWAAPHFIARRVIKMLREGPADLMPPVYSPWMVANLTLDAMPAGHGMDLSWDNVFYTSNSLGYVVATHQNVQSVPRQTVLTYYQPLDDDEPAVARQKALARSYDQWCELILTDLGHPHSDLRDHLVNLDVWLWGHAMARPVPGFIWGPTRERMQRPIGNIVFAHSDLSGLSIFEEAYTRGVRAADALLDTLHKT